MANLGELLKAASDSNVTFVYALQMPDGLCDLDELCHTQVHRKLAQLKELGVTDFGLMFDAMSVESWPCEEIKGGLSLAHAQARLANSVLLELSPSSLTVWPTQYAPTLVVPSVEDSPYLRDLGRHLEPDIQVVFMSNSAISAFLTSSYLSDLSEALRRPPILCEPNEDEVNDKKALFLQGVHELCV